MVSTSSSVTSEIAPRAGALVAPLVVVRDPHLYAQWWKESANRDEIAELLGMLTDEGDTEYNLQSLMLSVFQDTPDRVPWLQVHGLAEGVIASWLVLDADPSYDGQGVLDGSDVVLNVHADLPGGLGARWLTVSVYVDHPAIVLAPQADDSGDALAEVIDAMVVLINAEIADRDKFTVAARAVVVPAAGDERVAAERTVRDVINVAATEIAAKAELPDSGTVDALNLMVNAVIHRLFTNPEATLSEVVDECYADVSLEDVLSWIGD